GRRVRIREVADEHVVRQLSPFQTELVAERRGPLVLSGTGMHVERDEPRGPSVHRYREVLSGFVPRLRGLDLGEDEPEELRREVQDRLPHGAVFEIRPDLAGIEAEALVLRP